MCSPQKKGLLSFYASPSPVGQRFHTPLQHAQISNVMEIDMSCYLRRVNNVRDFSVI
jgi:hypothetical protein